MIPNNSKAALRLHFLKIRKAISAERRLAAEQKLLRDLPALLRQFERIASFDSFGDEISLRNFNCLLAKEGRLLLPLRTFSSLSFFLVEDPQKDLIQSSLGFREPDPSKCQSVLLGKRDLLLVPGVSFDENNHRLGYGKGYYDRTLDFICCESWGIAFEEQKSPIPFPVDRFDRAVQKVFFF